MNVSQWVGELTSLLGDGKVAINSDLSHPFGNEGYVSVYPTKEEEIAKVLKYASETEKKVVVSGNGSKRGYGGIKEHAHIHLSLQNYEGIVEHSPENMTVTVKSGTDFHQLQSYLREHGQQVPLDPKQPKEATIGGVIATNDSGPKRFAYGSAKDCVLGLKMIYPDGSIFRFGGKVMKNVAGYDMKRLFIGSMGTIGVISEVTLKLLPLPKDESVVFLQFNGKEEVRLFTTELLDTQLEPTAIELLTPNFANKLLNKECYTLLVSFEGVAKAIQYEEQYIEKLIEGKNISMIIKRGEELSHFKDEFYSTRPYTSNENFSKDDKGVTTSVLKIGVKNLDVISILNESEDIANECGIYVEGHGGLGHGLCELTLKGKKEGVLNGIKELRRLAEKLGGYCVAIYLPRSLREVISVWGDQPTYFFLLDGIKKKIDPNRTLNVGRFVGGI